ncbi:LytR/AlgR family response regulator transcription factor [Maribellus maritimus]|uniref:LytR/AlgR family response regulator transcription factor n=1 Tax=Maribellus maritimus TaxID=2870838 RepID=UPI001EEBF6EF|nr:LytTR family DNA-binding domain-containing protein [Maribellus maritimus]MCG6188225.1 LytTR family DNA-binding domain-containing protein [Maribellus maritimus]
MKVVIVEDERLAAEKLQRLLKQVDSGIEVLKVLESVEESVNWFSANVSPNLVFMDIQLDDGISFEIFDTLKIEVPVIFTTAFDEYAIRAFKVNSVDYLLKPVEKAALENSLRKYRNIYTAKQTEINISKVFEHMAKTYKSRFLVKIGTHFQSVPVENISCFFVEERSTFLKTKTGKNYDLDYSLDQIQKLVAPELFFRINRNFLVNINSISEILSYSTSRLKLKLHNFSSEGLIVSRDKAGEFKLWMDR